MECILQCLIMLLVSFFSFAHDNDTSSAPLKSLQVGDTMPDISLGEVTNNHTGKTRFSEFNGKLIILDFWATTCSSCIGAFPKMEALQEDFGNKIQIFLVDPYENRDEVNRRVAVIKGYHPNFRMPNLPSITDAKQLQQLFPGKYSDDLLGRHVWIGEKGVVKAITHEYSTYAQKIRDYFAGKKQFFLHDFAGAPLYDGNESYLEYLYKPDSSIGRTVVKASFFTRFNNNLAPITSGFGVKYDSVAGIFRYTYINATIVDLYISLFKDSIEKYSKRMIYWQRPKNMRADNPIYNYLQMTVADTSRYTLLYMSNEDITDSLFVQSEYCYEQVLPLSLSQEARQSNMLEDLNLYFGRLYGTTVSLEKMKVLCYILVRTSSQDRLSSIKEYSLPENFTDKGIKKTRVVTSNIRSAVEMLVPRSVFEHSLSLSINGQPRIFLDETDFKSNPIEVVFPDGSGLKTMEDVRKALQPYDLDIIQAQRELPFVVIHENGVAKSN